MRTRVNWIQGLLRIALLVMVNVLLAQHVCATGAEVDYRGRVVNELQQPIAGAVPQLPVDGREAIDVEEDERDRMASPLRAVDFLRHRHVERRTGDQRRQRIPDDRLRRGEHQAFGHRHLQVERRQAHQLAHEAPGL